MESEKIEVLSELSPSEIASVSGGGIRATMYPLEEGVYIDGILIHMHAVTLNNLLKSGAVYVITGGVP